MKVRVHNLYSEFELSNVSVRLRVPSSELEVNPADPVCRLVCCYIMWECFDLLFQVHLDGGLTV